MYTSKLVHSSLLLPRLPPSFIDPLMRRVALNDDVSCASSSTPHVMSPRRRDAHTHDERGEPRERERERETMAMKEVRGSKQAIGSERLSLVYKRIYTMQEDLFTKGDRTDG